MDAAKRLLFQGRDAAEDVAGGGLGPPDVGALRKGATFRGGHDRQKAVADGCGPASARQNVFRTDQFGGLRQDGGPACGEQAVGYDAHRRVGDKAGRRVASAAFQAEDQRVESGIRARIPVAGRGQNREPASAGFHGAGRTAVPLDGHDIHEFARLADAVGDWVRLHALASERDDQHGPDVWIRAQADQRSCRLVEVRADLAAAVLVGQGDGAGNGLRDADRLHAGAYGRRDDQYVVADAKPAVRPPPPGEADGVAHYVRPRFPTTLWTCT